MKPLSHRTQPGRQRLTGPGSRMQQAALAFEVPAPNFALESKRLPAPFAKPIFDWSEAIHPHNLRDTGYHPFAEQSDQFAIQDSRMSGSPVVIARIMEDGIKPRVLVCDDEASFLRLLEINLKRAGFDVLTASDGSDALQLALEGKPDLIVVDLLMPRMDGIELVRRIREESSIANTPVIVLTAHAFDEDHQKATDAGANEVLAKPVDLPTLIERMRHLVAN